MKVRSLLIMLLAGIISSCSIPLGTPGQTQSATLSLAFDGPLTSSSARAVNPRLVTPDSNYVQLIVTDASGAVVQTAQQAWSPGSGVPSMKVALSKVPMGVPLNLTVKTVTSLTDPVVTGQGSTTMTLAAGANTARIAIVPTAEVNKTLVLGDSEELDLEAGNWVLWQLNFSGTQASQAVGASRAAPKETLSAFKLTLPEGLKAYLQSPSGNTIEVVTPGSISLPIEVGTWNLLLWNQDYEGSTFGISLSAAASVDYGYTLRNVVLPYRPSSEPTIAKLVLYNRGGDPYTATVTMPFTMTADVTGTLNWVVGPQQDLAIVFNPNDPETTTSVPIVLEDPVTSSGQSLDLYLYDIVDSNSALLASTKVRSAPANFGVSEDGLLSWAQSTDDNAYGYEIWAGNLSDGTAAQDILTGVGTTTYSLPESNLLPPAEQTYRYRLRTLYTAANGMHYAGSFSAIKTFTSGGVVATPTDTTPPIVVIGYPSGGTLIDNTVYVDGQMVDDHPLMSSLEYEISHDYGASWSGPYKDFSYEGSYWSFPIYDVQSYASWMIRVRGTDESGLQSQYATTSFYADTSPPTITIANTPDESYPQGYVITFAGYASDDYAIADIPVYVDGTLAGTATYGGNTWSFSLDTSALSTGSHMIAFTIWDFASHSSGANINFNVY